MESYQCSFNVGDRLLQFPSLYSFQNTFIGCSLLLSYISGVCAQSITHPMHDNIVEKALTLEMVLRLVEYKSFDLDNFVVYYANAPLINSSSPWHVSNLALSTYFLVLQNSNCYMKNANLLQNIILKTSLLSLKNRFLCCFVGMHISSRFIGAQIIWATCLSKRKKIL